MSEPLFYIPVMLTGVRTRKTPAHSGRGVIYSLEGTFRSDGLPTLKPELEMCMTPAVIIPRAEYKRLKEAANESD